MLHIDNLHVELDSETGVVHAIEALKLPGGCPVDGAFDPQARVSRVKRLVAR